MKNLFIILFLLFNIFIFSQDVSTDIPFFNEYEKYRQFYTIKFIPEEICYDSDNKIYYWYGYDEKGIDYKMLIWFSSYNKEQENIIKSGYYKIEIYVEVDLYRNKEDWFLILYPCKDKIKLRIINTKEERS